MCLYRIVQEGGEQVCTCKMVAKSAALREFLTLDTASKRSSVYVNPDREKYFELPLFFESDDDLTTCFNVVGQGTLGNGTVTDGVFNWL